MQTWHSRDPQLHDIGDDKEKGLKSSSPLDHPQISSPLEPEKQYNAKILVFILVALLLTLLSPRAVRFTEEAQRGDLKKPLIFTEDGTFQISIFEDLHFGEST